MQVVDEEIDRLPARLRSAVVLCYLDGRTTEQAAEILGIPRGTVLSRLSTARDKLRDRLTRRGLTLPIAGFSALTFSTQSPANLIPLAVRSALTGASPLITRLVQGVFHAMLLTKVKIATAVVLGIGLAGAGVGWIVVPGSGPGVAVAEEQSKNEFEGKTVLVTGKNVQVAFRSPTISTIGGRSFFRGAPTVFRDLVNAKNEYGANEVWIPVSDVEKIHVFDENK